MITEQRVQLQTTVDRLKDSEYTIKGINIHIDYFETVLFLAANFSFSHCVLNSLHLV